MILYFAARYGRREELVRYREELHSRGMYRVNSRWLHGEHQIGPNGFPITKSGEEQIELANPEGYKLREKFLQDDLDDIMAADGIVCFTEGRNPPDGAGRGGRHVEFGVVLGYNLYCEKVAKTWGSKHLIVVGPMENLFYYHTDVIQYSDWEMAYNFMHSVNLHNLNKNKS